MPARGWSDEETTATASAPEGKATLSPPLWLLLLVKVQHGWTEWTGHL